MQRGIVWDYDRDSRRFTVRFCPSKWECPDAGLTWEDLLGEKPCLTSSTHRAHLYQLRASIMIPQPRGHRPRDAVWDQRKCTWVDSTGCDYDPSELPTFASLSASPSRSCTRWHQVMHRSVGKSDSDSRANPAGG